MNYEYKKLRGRIREKYSTEFAFSKAVGISRTQMSSKLNGHAGFDQKDIVLWCEKLDIELADAYTYFFA